MVVISFNVIDTGDWVEPSMIFDDGSKVWFAAGDWGPLYVRAAGIYIEAYSDFDEWMEFVGHLLLTTGEKVLLKMRFG